MIINFPVVDLRRFLASNDESDPLFEQIINDNLALQHNLFTEFAEVTLMADDASQETLCVQAWAVTPKSKRNRKVQIGVIREDYVETLLLNYPNLVSEPINVSFSKWIDEEVFAVGIDIHDFTLPELPATLDMGALRGIQMPIINEDHLSMLSNTFSRCNEIAQTLPNLSQEAELELLQMANDFAESIQGNMSYEERRISGMLLRLLECVTDKAEDAINAINQSLNQFAYNIADIRELFAKDTEVVSQQMKAMFSKMDGYNSIGITSYENLFKANEDRLSKIPALYAALNAPVRNDKQEIQQTVDIAHIMSEMRIQTGEYYLVMVHLITREYLLEKYSGITPAERKKFRKMSLWSKDLSSAMLVKAVVELRQVSEDNPYQIPSHLTEVLTRMGKENIVDVPFRKTPQILADELSQIIGVDISTYTMKQYLKRLCK